MPGKVAQVVWNLKYCTHFDVPLLWGAIMPGLLAIPDEKLGGGGNITGPPLGN